MTDRLQLAFDKSPCSPEELAARNELLDFFEDVFRTMRGSDNVRDHEVIRALGQISETYFAQTRIVIQTHPTTLQPQ